MLLPSLFILHFLECVIFLSHPAITLSWARYLVYHLVFLTCFSASEGIRQVPWYKAPSIVTRLCISCEQVLPLSIMACPLFYSGPGMEVELNHMFVK